MARYTLTKNYTEIAESYGVFQNSSGNAEIEITNDVAEAGIILRPFQTATISQKVYARKIGNAGACLLTVLPLQKLWDTPNAVPPKRSDDTETESDTTDISTVDAYDDLFSGENCQHQHKPPMPPLSVKETPTHYLVSVSKDSLKHQNKFLLQFDDRQKG